MSALIQTDRLHLRLIDPDHDAADMLALLNEPGFIRHIADRGVRTLAQAYSERPVTLIRVIYALRDSKIRSFADAFRVRKS